MATLSIKMLNTLRRGKKKLSREAQEKIKQYILSQRADEVFFMDKSGKADIYYTAFGLMLSYLFGIKIDTRQARLQFEKRRSACNDLIHYAAYSRSLMLMDLIDGNYLRLLVGKNICRDTARHVSTTEGGSGMRVWGDDATIRLFPHNDPRSPYSRFIWLSLMEDSRQKIANKKEILESLGAYKVSGGGYSNIAGDASASVNATAAALSVKGQLGGYRLHKDVDYLYQAQDASGGFCASEEAPLPDILSTATALFVLNCYGLEPLYPPNDFIEAHWLESGGFSPTILEDTSDIEYTCYGLLALGTC
ncbi:hypothetical protein FACS189411_00430 [Bacteroidia bacterium]|nr:hypothetical protein FACS189411_00430 [Bacteroidia bacterium]